MPRLRGEGDLTFCFDSLPRIAHLPRNDPMKGPLRLWARLILHAVPWTAAIGFVYASFFS